MGLRASVVVCVTSFLLGALFTHWTADSLTLWKSPVTDEHLWVAAAYYAVLAKGPAPLLAALLAIALLGGVTLAWSLRDGEAGNLMFDGGSIFLYITTVVMYIYSVMPNLLALFTALPAHLASDPFPPTLRGPTLELASSNLIASVALTGVLLLQAGRWWAEADDDDDDEDSKSEDGERGVSEKPPKDEQGQTPEVGPEDVPPSVAPLPRKKVQRNSSRQP